MTCTLLLLNTDKIEFALGPKLNLSSNEIATMDDITLASSTSNKSGTYL